MTEILGQRWLILLAQLVCFWSVKLVLEELKTMRLILTPTNLSEDWALQEARQIMQLFVQLFNHQQIGFKNLNILQVITNNLSIFISYIAFLRISRTVFLTVWSLVISFNLGSLDTSSSIGLISEGIISYLFELLAWFHVLNLSQFTGLSSCSGVLDAQL